MTLTNYKTQAQVNPAGLISDRQLYLAQDQFTLVEAGSDAARYMLAPPDTLIPAEHVARLGLEIQGGKIVQNREGAKGGPEAGVTPQSASEPPSHPVHEAAPGPVMLSGFDAKEKVKPQEVTGPEYDPRSGQPKSDPRFQRNSGSLPPKEEARPNPEADKKAQKGEMAREQAVDAAVQSARTAKSTRPVAVVTTGSKAPKVRAPKSK